MAEHSPLPWQQNVLMVVSPHGNPTSIYGGLVICHCGGNANSHECEANSAFIVRACNSFDDLLAACRAMIDACEGIEEAYEEDSVEYSIAHKAADIGRAALAKATGGDDA